MKIRRRVRRYTKRSIVDRICRFVWNGLVEYCPTKNRERIQYLKKINRKTDVYCCGWINEQQFTDQLRNHIAQTPAGFRAELDDCCIYGVSRIVDNGVLIADADTDDKDVWFFGFDNIIEWGRCKFVGNKDLYGAYDSLNAKLEKYNEIKDQLTTKSIVVL